jgi:iron complex outermembrane receptor protein
MTSRAKWQSTIPWPVCAVILAATLATSYAQAQASLPVKIYAQELVDRTIAQHPGLRTAAIYATPPKSAAATIVASNIGRIGKTAEAADLEVIASGRPRVVAAGADERIEIELPLHDAAGQTIGALDLVWLCPAGSHRGGFEKSATAVRDALARRILNLANLYEPFPYVPAATTRSRAQKLIEDAVARHPDVTVLALRAKLPPGNELVLLGSTFGRHGKAADADDMKVLDAAAPITGLYSNGKRFGVDLAVRNRNGVAIGTMNVGYAYRDGEDRKALEAKAVALRDEIQARIGDAATLGEIDP